MLVFHTNKVSEPLPKFEEQTTLTDLAGLAELTLSYLQVIRPHCSILYYVHHSCKIQLKGSLILVLQTMGLGTRVKLSEGCDHWFESRSLLNSLHTPTAKYKIPRVAPGLLFVPGFLLNSLTSAGPEFLTIQEEQRKEEQANHCSSSLS